MLIKFAPASARRFGFSNMRRQHSKLVPLTPEKPVALRPHLARAIGTDEALIVEVIWVESQGARTVRAHDGRLFVHLPTRVLGRALPCISATALQHARNRLVEMGIVVQARTRDAGKDAAAWFAIDTAALQKVYPLFIVAPPLAAPAGTDSSEPKAPSSVRTAKENWTRSTAELATEAHESR